MRALMFKFCLNLTFHVISNVAVAAALQLEKIWYPNSMPCTYSHFLDLI